MPVDRCPGQDQRFWKLGDIFEAPCPYCDAAIEFFKDDPARRCGSCGRTVANPRFDAGCAQWCPYAEACLGESPEAAGEVSIVDALVREAKEYFGDDRRRFAHAVAVLDWAERLLKAEGGDPLVVRAAAILHDIGIPEAERKHGSAAPRYQEREGPPVARPILQRQGVPADRIDPICRIIGSHHTARDVDTPEFRIVWDADRIVNVPEECAGMDRERALQAVTDRCRTETGRRLARAAVERFFAGREDG
jgi:hypothetical protein